MAAKLKIEKRGDEIKKKSSPLKLLSQSQPNFAEMILGWPPFKIVSVSAVQYPRWPPLLKIEISSNGQNCYGSWGSPDTILEGGHPRIIPQKFGCNWPSGF
jgi:hypothetical protein